MEKEEDNEKGEGLGDDKEEDLAEKYWEELIQLQGIGFTDFDY